MVARGRSDKIRVLHICDKFGVKGSRVHGISRTFSWWFPLFDKNRFELALCGLTYPDVAGEELEKGGIRIHYIKRGRLNPLKIIDLYRIIRTGGYHITHLHGYGSHVFGMIAGRLAGAKIIVHEHFVDPNMPWYTRPLYFIMGRAVKYGLAVSKSVKDFMVAKMHIRPSLIEVLYNGVPLHEFTPADASEVLEERRRWGIQDDDIIIGSVGRLHPQKGYAYLLDAAPKVLGKFPNARFMIVGDGADRAILEAQCERLGISDRVIFTGFSNRVRVLMTMMDVVVIASLYEGTPNTLYESFAIGKPIVATPVDGLGEILVHGETACLVPPRDSGALAQGLVSVLGDRDYLRRLAGNAKGESRRFDGRETVRFMESYYAKLCPDTR